MTPSLLQALNVSCERGGRQLFQPISFSLAAGAALHLEGDNGAGKTTLLRSLSGLSPLSQGEVLWRGVPSHAAASGFKRELLYLGHALGLKDELTALENVQLNAALAGQTINREKALQALATQGLKSRAHLPLRVLSQGQKRRVALARLQVAQAKLWLLDEPFVALDTDAVKALQLLLQQHVAQGGALVFTSHQAVDLGAVVQTARLQA
ncbi:MAG: Cytochrome c biosis ATP-binding export protein CcmA [Pseudomonadota bacterium]|jgi:heme exporter protein A